MSCIWNPWRGCHRCSEGCKFCYIHKGDAKRGRDTNEIVKSENFYRMVEKKKRAGEYKVAPNGGLVYLCFQSDFLLEDADEWRGECWKIIKERKDCSFLFLTILCILSSTVPLHISVITFTAPLVPILWHLSIA